MGKAPFENKRLPPTMAELAVLADAALFRYIVAFQCGLEMPLLAFWRAHTPDRARLWLTPRTTKKLVLALAAHGTPRLLDMAARATYCRRVHTGSGAVVVDTKLWLARVAPVAFKCGRADLVEWALATKSSSLCRSRAMWRDAITRFKTDDDTRMLDVLKKYIPLGVTALGTLVYHVSFHIEHLSLLRWLVKEAPGIDFTRCIARFASHYGTLPMLAFLLANGHTTCPRSTFRQTMRRLDVLAFLLTNYASSLDDRGASEIVRHSDPQVQQLAIQFAEPLQRGCAFWLRHGKHDAWLATVREWAARGLISPRWPISIDAAAANGNIGIVRFLHEQGIAAATTEAMDQAAEQGHWGIVEFLHDHRTEGCTTRARDAAIQQTKLEYVRLTRRSSGAV